MISLNVNEADERPIIEETPIRRRTEEIGDDLIVWHGDKWHGTYSLKYDADFFRGIRSGKLHFRVGARVVSEQDFWTAMQERGACTNGGN